MTLQIVPFITNLNTAILGQSKHGKAVYAGRNIRKGEEIIEFKGPILRRSEIPDLIHTEDDRYIQVGSDKYFGPSGELDDLINHSCDPNSWVRIHDDDVVLIALRDISEGEEIVWDYSTTMDEDDWEMDCGCGSKVCRKRVRDFKYLPKEIQSDYLAQGIVPDFIVRNLDS